MIDVKPGKTLDSHAYWTGGTAGLYRVGVRPEPMSPERWDGTVWQPDTDLLGELLDGATDLDETPAAEASNRFPAAFA